MEWSFLATAPNQLIAEMWQELLFNNSIPSTLRPKDTHSFLGISPHPCDLLVGDAMLDQARYILHGKAPPILEKGDSD